MTASQSALETGGNSSRRRRRSPAISVVSAIRTLLHDFHEVAEGSRLCRLRMNEEHGRAARARTGPLIDNLIAVALHVIEGVLNVGYAERDMGESTPSAALLH